jgi:hypothetical protein
MEAMNVAGPAMAVSANAIALPRLVGSCWPDDRVDELCRLRNDGLSFAKIAKKMGGTTRGAVAGQLRRLVDAGDTRLTANGPRDTCMDCGAKITRYSLGRCQRCAPLAAKVDARSIPDDFAERASEMTRRRMMIHYHASSSTICRWIKEAGLQKRSPGAGAPDGFVQIAPSNTLHQLKLHYEVGDCVIKRWCAEVGVAPKQPQHIVFRRNQFPPIKAHRDCSQVGQAADFLRKFGAVYRCFESGAAATKGTHWSRNGFVLTDAELIARAERLGWDPQAWRRVA